jgi:hypothetical protein
LKEIDVFFMVCCVFLGLGFVWKVWLDELGDRVKAIEKKLGIKRGGVKWLKT